MHRDQAQKSKRERVCVYVELQKENQSDEHIYVERACELRTSKTK